MSDPKIVDPVEGELSWIDPTTNEDGSPVTPGEITGYEVGVRDTSAAGSAAGTYPYGATAPETAEATTKELISALNPLLPKGKPLVFAVRAVTGAKDASNNQIKSDWSVESEAFALPVPPPVPTPPTNPTVA